MMQRNYGGDDYCKQAGLVTAQSNYEGLASGLVAEILKSGAAAVLNTPSGNYAGHADVLTPVAIPAKGEVLSAGDQKIMSDFCDAMVNHFAYYADPAKTRLGWHGPSLERTA